jgi:hypothetical protein
MRVFLKKQKRLHQKRASVEKIKKTPLEKVCPFLIGDIALTK